ncbi:MAG: ABC transporter ATP-binding protein [Candidatus Cloacimonetes bacterium HGW-Cloacimonetes-3]|jgi:ATP-binding cassette subfamily B protein|nr:MAG: ABC transporter ATP-binding protein [Candidatus Cloacimonetes bacterium HGW-Cloacimonetes-3]
MNQQYQEKEFTKNLDPKLWLAVLKQAMPYKHTMLWIAGLMTFMAGLDSILPLFTKYAIDNMIIPKSFDGILLFSLLYVGVVIVGFFTVAVFIHLTGIVETGMNYDLRKRCFAKLQSMHLAYYDRTPTGWIVARLNSDISRLGDIVAWGIVDLAWGFAYIVIVSIIVFTLSWKLALIFLFLLPFIGYFSIKFQKKLLVAYRMVRKLNSRITHSFGEGIHGAKTTKTLVREEANLNEFTGLNREMYSSSVKAAVASALFMPLILMVSSLGVGLVLWLGGVATINQSITYGALVAFISYTMQLFEPISNVARLFAEMQNGQAAAERVFSLLELEPEIVSSVPWDESWSKRTMQGDIQLQNISFAYKEGQAVFTDFDLHIRSGESVALVGETGTGKTTLVNLICRFYEPQTGSIKIDGYDLREIPLKWIHSQLGYVQQVPHLFQGSILENIRYGKLDASDAEVIRAAQLMNADSFIRELPGDYSYQVGESGNLLSTGQKQLLAFARVVLANPRLLILDEATASIDTETESLVQIAMNKVLQDRTGIVVAHRLSTIRNVDRILMMYKGRIIESGSHTELMHLKGRYYKLYMNQFMQETADAELAREA